MACRDCPRCTEPMANTLIMMPFRLLHWSLTFWNVGLLRRNCPICKHLLAIHQKHGGRFVD
jgi:biotin synthase-related radical SAM superfamily protein